MTNPPQSKLSAYEKLIHTPAFVRAHRSRLNGSCVAYSWRRGRKGYLLCRSDVAGFRAGQSPFPKASIAPARVLSRFHTIECISPNLVIWPTVDSRDSIALAFSFLVFLNLS